VGVSRDCPNFLSTPIISGTRKATNFNFGMYYGVHLNKNRLKIWEKSQRGRIQGLPKFFEYPLLSQERVKLRTSNLGDVFRASMQTKPRNYLGERECGRIQGLPKFLEYSLLSQERGKATNFQFCTHVLSIDRNKRPLQISGKVAVG